MDSSTKRHKHIDESSAGEEALDRISNLPDSILTHILSFLPTRDSFTTCVLSSRWRHLFASIPTLDFNDSYLNVDDELTDLQEKIKQRFVNFVYKALNRHEPFRIDRFRLKCVYGYDSADVDAWISAALFHNVQELVLQIDDDSYLLPHDLFNCKSLSVLKLNVNCELKVPTLVYLPSLRTLHLQFARLYDVHSTQKLFSSCSILEELCMYSCCLRGKGALHISNSTLKSLTIDHLYCDEDGDYEFGLDAPCIEYLKYRAPVAKGYTLGNLRSLVKADIGFTTNNNQLNGHIGDLLVGISEVKSLFLLSNLMEAFTQYCPLTFPNLTHLELLFLPGYGLMGLRNLLNSCPSLEVLVLSKVLVSGDGFLKHVPSCLLLHLREFILRNFYGTEDELNQVEYFLRRAQVLEKLTIGCYISPGEDSYILKKLLSYPRVSSTCRIIGV